MFIHSVVEPFNLVVSSIDQNVFLRIVAVDMMQIPQFGVVSVHPNFHDVVVRNIKLSNMKSLVKICPNRRDSF